MKYHCMVNAFAAALAVSPEELVEELSHDGLGMFEGTNIQRTHHVQEMIEVGFNIWGCCFCPIELLPQSTTSNQTFPILFGSQEKNFERFRNHLEVSQGVVLGIRSDKKCGHAVYNNYGTCSDQRGEWKLWSVDSHFIPSVYWRSVWTM